MGVTYLPWRANKNHPWLPMHPSFPNCGVGSQRESSVVVVGKPSWKTAGVAGDTVPI